MKKLAFFLSFVAIAAMTLASCEKNDLKGISLSKKSLTLTVGETETLKANLDPADAKAQVAWSSSDEAVASVKDGVVTAVAPGSATITATAGEFSAKCEVTVEPSFTPFGEIDGKFTEWAGIEGATEGNHTFKAASDDLYLYFFSHRTTEGRFSDIWGGGGYVYIGMNLDGNDETGIDLWGNGPYEFVGVIYPFAGSADAPEISETASAGEVTCMPDTFTLANVICKGVVDDEGVKIEYRIPRADLPNIPTTAITIYSWGNKDMSKVALTVAL